MAETLLSETSRTGLTRNLPDVPKMIGPGVHAVLDYGVASMYFGLWARMRHSHPTAAALACANGTMVLALALLTKYPGGLFRVISFKRHRDMDWVQAAVAGLGPALLGFAGDPEAAPFHAQATSEVGVIAATDWEAAA